MGADLQRKGRRKIGETTARIRPPSLLLSPACRPLESAQICVICGFSNSFTSGDLPHVPSESWSREQEVAPLPCRGDSGGGWLYKQSQWAGGGIRPVAQTKPMAGRGTAGRVKQTQSAVAGGTNKANCAQTGTQRGRRPQRKPVVRRLPRSARNDMFHRLAQTFKERTEGKWERQRPTSGLLPLYLLLLAFLWNLRKSA